MKTITTSSESKIGLLFKRQVKPEFSAVAALIPESGLCLREISESYSFSNFGGGGVRRKFEFVACEPDLRLKILSAINDYFIARGMSGRRGGDDDISYVFSSAHNAEIFTAE